MLTSEKRKQKIISNPSAIRHLVNIVLSGLPDVLFICAEYKKVRKNL